MDVKLAAYQPWLPGLPSNGPTTEDVIQPPYNARVENRLTPVLRRGR
jgi:hypothetical protein